MLRGYQYLRGCILAFAGVAQTLNVGKMCTHVPGAHSWPFPGMDLDSLQHNNIGLPTLRG